MPRMRHLLGPDGLVALGDLLSLRPLLAFDFDGTLAPIVAQHQAARVPSAIARRLAMLAQRLPVAIVSGRARTDLEGRLGFRPHFLVGSHGADDDPEAAMAHARQLEPARQWLSRERARLAKAGVVVEDKGASIALHYRTARDRARAEAAIADLLARLDPTLRTFGGKLVVNLVSADAPDKAQAVRDLVARTGSTAALFAGDDVNDEPVFASAPAGWLTVRVGRDDPHSRAGWFIDSTAEMPILLERMLAASEGVHG